MPLSTEPKECEKHGHTDFLVWKNDFLTVEVCEKCLYEKIAEAKGSG